MGVIRMFSQLMGLLLATSATADVTVSQVAGQAGDDVVTTREVQINYFVESVIFSDGSKNSSLKIVTTDPGFEKEVSRVLIEWVVFKEAESFNAANVPEEDVAKGVAMIRGVANNSENQNYWSKLLPTSTELKNIVQRKLRAKKFVQFKTKASVVPVTDAEALQYFQKNRIRFGNAPFANFKESIKQFLSQEQANSRIRDWFELLQRKYRVRKVALSVKSS